MKINFVTTNKFKVAESKEALSHFGIGVKQLDMEYEENHDDSIEEIAKSSAKKLAGKLNKAVIVEDTGIFFEAYDNFPGALPKFVFNSIGYDGIFRLLEGKSRKAYFKAVIGYCEPDKEPQIFEGYLHGQIAEEIHNIDKDCFPYERIFIPDADPTKTTSDMTTEEKNKISHRGESFRKLGQYLTKKK